MFNSRMAGLLNLLTICFDASLRSRKVVCHLQGFVRISVTVATLPFGQIWFRSVIRVWRTGVLTNRAARKHLASSPILDWKFWCLHFKKLQFLGKLTALVHFHYSSSIAWIFGNICQNIQKDSSKNQVSTNFNM